MVPRKSVKGNGNTLRNTKFHLTATKNVDNEGGDTEKVVQRDCGISM